MTRARLTVNGPAFRAVSLSFIYMVVCAVASAQPASPPPSSPSPPPPYSLPWLLRPVVPASVVRVDETLAFFEDPASGSSGGTFVTSLIATWRINPRWVPVFRETFIHNDPPTGANPSASAFSNPLLGINHLRPLGRDWRFSGFFASTIPIGSGGGDDADPGRAAAQSAAIPARSSMDNALFAVNYWTVIGGLGVARVTRGLTLQGEVTVLQLFRVRGPETQDEARTNFTAGVHAGHFFSPRFSLGGEVRMQRWLTNAAPVRNDPSAREQLTFGVGPRFHFKVGAHWVRPGISYTRAFDDPMERQGYDVIQVDVPVAF
jgi:hypothetical protein